MSKLTWNIKPNGTKTVFIEGNEHNVHNHKSLVDAITKVATETNMGVFYVVHGNNAFSIDGIDALSYDNIKHNDAISLYDKKLFTQSFIQWCAEQKKQGNKEI